MSSGWWDNIVSLHHWEAGWVESVGISLAGGSIWAIWGRPLLLSILLHETDSGVSPSRRNDVVSLHHWEAGRVESVVVFLAGGSIRAVWRRPLHKTICVLLHKSDSRMSSGWWDNIVSLHHWEAGWVESVGISLAGGSIWAIWGRPLLLSILLHETDSGVSPSRRNDVVSLHHWEAGRVESVVVFLAGGSIRAVWRRPLLFSSLLDKSDCGMSSGWWNDVISLHHWETCWMKSIYVFLSGCCVGAVW